MARIKRLQLLCEDKDIPVILFWFLTKIDDKYYISPKYEYFLKYSNIHYKIVYK